MRDVKGSEMLSEDIAEIIGVIIGDGCISRYKTETESEHTVILITGSWDNDSEYYKIFIQPTMQSFFGYSGRLYHRKDDDSARYWITNKYIVNWFLNIGLPLSPKTDTIKIPNRLIENKKLAIACLRGIFNSDGCVFRRYSKQYKNHSKLYSNYAVIEIKVKSNELLNQIKEILSEIGIRTTIITKHTRTKAFVMRITSQKDIAKFMKVVKPRLYHINRYESIINKGPVAQPGRAPASISS
jgi:intein/homing endonuclease